MVEASGFEGFRIVGRTDVFSGSVHESSAVNFGTVGITFVARKRG